MSKGDAVQIVTMFAKNIKNEAGEPSPCFIILIEFFAILQNGLDKTNPEYV